MRLDNDKLKQNIFIIALFALGGFLFWLLKGYLSAFLGALVFYILLRQPFFYLTEKAKRKWNRQLAIMLLLLVSFLVLVVPVFFVSVMLSGKVGYLISHYQELLLVLHQWSDRAKEYIGMDLFSHDSVAKLTDIAANVAPQFVSATASALVEIFMVYFLLYFMFAQARQLEESVRNYLPFKPENNRLLLRELKRQTEANAIGIPALALLIGFAAWLAYWIFGVDNPLFWGVLTGIGSVIPIIGIGIVWVPVAVFLFLSGQEGHAIGLTIYCLVTFTVLDNGFRVIVLKKLGDIHPVITFFGVFAGIEMFGFVGIFFGPLLISYFILLLKIYRNEYLGEHH